MYYRTTSASNTGTVEVEVYDGGNALGGSTTVSNVPDALETSFLGIVAHPGDIRRVNLWTDGNSVAGADNIHVYWVPEPAAGGAAGAALATLAALGGRRRSRVS
jgi:hypothetical protein